MSTEEVIFKVVQTIVLLFGIGWGVFAWVNKKIDAGDKIINDKIDKLFDGFDKVYGKFDEINNKVDEVKNDISSFKLKVEKKFYEKDKEYYKTFAKKKQD